MGRPRNGGGEKVKSKIHGGSTKKSIGKTKTSRKESYVRKKESIVQPKKRRGMKRNNSSLNETDEFIDSVLKRFTPMPEKTPGRGQRMPDPFEYRPVTIEELPGMLDGVEKSIKAYHCAAMLDSAGKHERARIEKVSLTQAHLLKEILIREIRLVAMREENDRLRAATNGCQKKEDGQEKKWDRKEANVKNWTASYEDGRRTKETDDEEAIDQRDDQCIGEEIDAPGISQVDDQLIDELGVYSAEVISDQIGQSGQFDGYLVNEEIDAPLIDEIGAMVEISTDDGDGRLMVPSNQNSKRSLVLAAPIDPEDDPMISLSVVKVEADEEDNDQFLLIGRGDEISTEWDSCKVNPIDQVPSDIEMDQDRWMIDGLFEGIDANFGVDFLRPSITEPLGNVHPSMEVFSSILVDDGNENKPEDHAARLDSESCGERGTTRRF